MSLRLSQLSGRGEGKRMVLSYESRISQVQITVEANPSMVTNLKLRWGKEMLVSQIPQ